MATPFRQGNRRGAKLTVSQVYDIRALAAQGTTQGALARLYQVSIVSIGRIVRREVWQDLPEEAPTEEELHRRAKESEAKFLGMLRLKEEAEKSPGMEMKRLENEFGVIPKGPINPLEEKE